ncbi:MAG: sigma-70 family RNA polymerase sigma factor [Caldilinea sp. CFX5]|nr:sigma-70 family RNA polymerase sigma factor [Caldilinea sp. CFX5]
MSKRTQVKRLARILGCTRNQAKQFGQEINRQLALRGQRGVSLAKVVIAVEKVGSEQLTPQGIVNFLYHDLLPSTPIACADKVKTVPSHIQSTFLIDCSREEFATEQHAPNTIQLVSLSADSLTPVSDRVISDPYVVLDNLLSVAPSQVTYGQIEAALRLAGYDPFACESEYSWLIEQLEVRQILVVDQIIDEQGILAQLEADAQANSAEVQQLLVEIFGKPAAEDILLTAEEQRRLIEIVRDGERAKAALENAPSEIIKQELCRQTSVGKQARETLLMRNRGLVGSLVLKYMGKTKHLEFEDLFQEGMMGLDKAIERFDLDLNMHLSTYATWWIRQAITRAVADQDRTIRIPVHRYEDLVQYQRAVNELELLLEHTPTAVEIAAHLNRLSPNVVNAFNVVEGNMQLLPAEIKTEIERAVVYVQRLEELSNLHPLSLDQPVRVEGDTSVIDLIPDPVENPVETAVFERLLTSQIKAVLDVLTPRERLIIIHRFGLDGNEEHTLEAIGQKLNVTRERIRQIEAKALHKLRHPRRLRLLKDFCERKVKENLHEYSHSDPVPRAQSNEKAAA